MLKAPRQRLLKVLAGGSVASVIANESQWTLTPAPAVMSHIGSGKVRAIGHSLPKPSPLLVNISQTASYVPEAGQSMTTAQQEAIQRLAEQMLSLAMKAGATLPELEVGVAVQAKSEVKATRKR